LFQLSGSLGHRLVEVLYQQDAFDVEEAELCDRATAVLAGLYEREGALLLRPGMAFERSQLERQLVSSVVELSRALRAAHLRIVAVEYPIDVTHGAAKVEGRIDLVVAHADGTLAIIDMKWGIARYREQLESGQALQLALYAFAHAAERAAPALPDAAYFSLKQGKLFGLPSSVLGNAEVVSGPSLADTWQRAERSLSRATQALAARRLPVTGLRHSLPLLSALGVPEAEHPTHFQHEAEVACQYCGFDSLCGRRWESLP
jgi:RecB family exonuclease